jgi:hypothetical protein
MLAMFKGLRARRATSVVLSVMLLMMVAPAGVSANPTQVTVTSAGEILPGGLATFTVNLRNSNNSTHAFAVTGIAGTVVTAGQASLVANGCTIFTNHETDDLLPVTIQTTAGIPAGDYTITFTVTEYDSATVCSGTSSYTAATADATLSVSSLVIHMYQVDCPTYTLVPANESYDTLTYDATGGHTGDLNHTAQYATASVSDIPAGCTRAAGWAFNLHEGSATGTLIEQAVTGSTGSVDVLLNATDAAYARTGGGVWVDDVVPANYGFGAVRCFQDILYSDNSENINAVPAGTTEVTCIGFNVRPVITFNALAPVGLNVGPITLTATSSSGLPVTYAVTGPCSVAGNILTVTAVGNCVITASSAAQATPRWTAPVPVTQTLAITLPILTITALGQSKTYGSAYTLLTGATHYSVTGLLAGDAVTGVTLTAASTPTGLLASAPAGSYIIRPSLVLPASYRTKYNVVYVDGALTVNPAVLTVTADPKTKTYGQVNPALTYVIAGYVNGQNGSVLTGTPTLTTTALQNSNVGSYPINVDVSTVSAPNYTFTPVNSTLTITKAPSQTITFGALANKTYGDPSFTVSATASSGLAVTFGVTGNCTIVGNTVTITGAGSCTVTASQAGDGNWPAATPVSQSFNIAKAVLTVTGDPKTKTYGQVNPTLTATITGFKNGDLPAVVSGAPTLSTTALTNSNVGSYPITVGAGTLAATNYSFTTVNGTLTITQAPSQTITFGALANKTYGDPSFTVSATASSGLAVTFGVTGNCSIVGNTVTITGAGSCSVTASQAGNANWPAATPVTQSFNIAKAVLTVTGDPKTKTYGQVNPALTATIAGLVNGDPASVVSGAPSLSTTAGQFSNVGSYPITVGVGTLAATNYTFSTVNGTLTITQAPSQTITFGALANKTYGDPSFTVSATASSGLAVTFGVTGNCSIAGNTVTVTGAGSCNVTASQAGDVNWPAAAPVTRSFSIAKAVLTVTADSFSRAFGQANPILTSEITGFQYTDTISVVSGFALVTTTADSSSGVGTYPITVDLNTLSATNYTFTAVNGTLTVTPAASQTIDFGPLADKTYGDPAFTISATATSGLPVTFQADGNCSLTGNTVHLGSVGLCTITASQGGNTNWPAAADVVQSFTVQPAVLTVKADDQSMTYNGTFPTLTATISGYVNGDDSSILSGDPGLSTLATPTSGVGTYPITAGAGTLTAPNYTFTGVGGTLTITAASQSITFGPLGDKKYGDPTFDLTATAPGGTVTFTATGDCTVSGNTVTIIGAGSCTITAHQGGDGNWDPAADVSQSFGIDPAVLTVTADPQTMPFGGTVPALTYTITGYVNGEDSSVITGTPNLATTADGSSHGGTYPITVDVSGMSAENYTFSNADGTLTVEPIAQAITFGPLADKTYGDPDFDLTATAPGGKVVFTASGNCTVSGATVTITGAGSCTITANQPGDADYTAAPPVSQSFDIAQAHLMATADDKTMVYGASVPALTYTITGFVNGDNAGSVTFTGKLILYTAADSSSDVGKYAISDSTFNLETDNYYVTFALGYLTITKADQTIAFANPGSKTVNAAPFALGATASSGLAVAYVVNSGPCSVDTSGTLTITGAGNCSVTASQGGNIDFNAATPVTQVFSIGKLNQTITFVNPGTQTTVTPPFDLGATASSGLPVTYTVNKVLGINSSCTVSGSIVTITGAGFCNITASQPGDATYNAAPNVTRNFLINKLNQTITFAALPNVTFGVAPITLTATASSGLPITYIAAGKCTVSGNVLTITGVGNCLVTATQPGNGSYWPALPVIRAFAITKADQVITFANPGAKTYGDAPFNLGATAPGGPVTYQVTSGTCTVDAAGVLTIHSTGDCTVVASQAGNANYNAAPDVSQTFTVGPATPEIDVTCPVSVVFTGSAQTPPCTATLKGPGMADTDVTGSIVFSNNTAVGTATASAHWDGNSNYLPADGQTTFQIVAAGSTVTIDCPASVAYTGSAITPCTATATGDGMDPVTLTGSEIVYSNNLNAGTATVSASWGGSTTNGGNSSSTTFEITKVDLTVTANDQTMAVGDTSFDLGNTDFTPTGLLGSDHVDTAHLTSSGADPAAAKGTYDINIGSAEGVGLSNYNISYVKGTLTVTDKFVLTVTADNKTRDYKKANPAFTYHISGYQDGDGASVVTTDPTCTTTATTASLPGTYHITCSGADAASGKYVFNYVIGTLTISGNVVGGVTAPPTATDNGNSTPGGDTIPLFALLICIAFGGLGLLAAQVQRKSTRA